MSSKKTFDRSSKQTALGLWIAISAATLGGMLLPLYWFWDRIASRGPGILILILGLLAWALFNWGKLVFSMGRRIRRLPEE
jgi:hypothetical protein